MFDDVRFGVMTNEAFFRVDSEEGPYNAGTRYDIGNSGHRPQRGAPLAVPPPSTPTAELPTTTTTTPTGG